MCGRYAATAGADELVAELDVDVEALGAPLAPRYNLAPTDAAPVVLARAPKDDPQATPVTQLRALTWGLVPSWSTDRSGAARMINARAETLLDKPAFRTAARSRRCLVPATGYYEWQRSPVALDPRGKPRKQPFFISRRDGAPMTMAGLYEFWRDPTRTADDPDAWLVTFAVVTTGADPDLGRIHDRQPLVLDREHREAWLRSDDPDVVQGLLALHRPGRLDAYPVTTAVNSVRNDGPHLLDPAPAGDLEGVVDPFTGEIL